LKRPFHFFVNIVNLSHLRSQQGLVGQLEVLENEFFFHRWNQVLVHQSLSEFLLVVSQLVLVEVKLVICRDIGRLQLLGEDGLGVDSPDPRVKQDLLQTLEGAESHLGILMQQSREQAFDLSG